MPNKAHTAKTYQYLFCDTYQEYNLKHSRYFS